MAITLFLICILIAKIMIMKINDPLFLSDLGKRINQAKASASASEEAVSCQP